MDNIFSLKGNLNRSGFFYAFLCLILLAFGIHYLTLYLVASDLEPTTYFILKSILGLFYLILFSPFIIRRLNDIGASAWWIMIMFIAYPFELRNIVLIENLLDFKINPFSPPILVLDIGVLIFMLILFFRAGSPNQSFNLDGAKSASPS